MDMDASFHESGEVEAEYDDYALEDEFNAPTSPSSKLLSAAPSMHLQTPGGEHRGLNESSPVPDEAASRPSGEIRGQELSQEIEEIPTTRFSELTLPVFVVEEIRACWVNYLKNAASPQAAGEAVFSAIFEAAPSLQSMFKSPRAVMAMRFMDGLTSIINLLDKPKALKIAVETLGFKHLNLEVTVPRVVLFRDAILDLLATELPEFSTSQARSGFASVLNWLGGSFIYVRVTYSSRLSILSVSWAAVNSKKTPETPVSGSLSGEHAEVNSNALVVVDTFKANDSRNRKPSPTPSGRRESKLGKSALTSMSREEKKTVQKVPETFEEMFKFNAAVMGLARQHWMVEVLACFDALVTNIGDPKRLQEECDVLSLQLAKHTQPYNLKDFKQVMLASLRSLLPQGWNSDNEVAWTWLWENVEGLISANHGKPSVYYAALKGFYDSLDQSMLNDFRNGIYSKFFGKCSEGQEFFKQSTTRLHFIADKIISMTADIFKEPAEVMNYISAIGLRHVGYAVPTDLFGPFVSACIEVVQYMVREAKAEEAFRWSLGLIARVLTRTIEEGSTIVMRAINANCARQLRKAVACAPRGDRAMWTLNVQVGSQCISPFMWAIESGSMDAAKAIIIDLLTIRADRENYYYAADQLFSRHTDVVQRICADAHKLLPTLLDGLIWRSRVTQHGRRRVNFFVKNLIVNTAGELADPIRAVVHFGDPGAICHPSMVIALDTIWSKLASRAFLFSKAWFLFSMAIFIATQCVLTRVDLLADPGFSSGPALPGVVVCIILGRTFIYLNMLVVTTLHIRSAILDHKHGRVVMVNQMQVPKSMASLNGVCGLAQAFCMLVMFALEPLFHCASQRRGGAPALASVTHCEDYEALVYAYSIFSMLSALLYFCQTLDMSVFNTKVSAYVLVCRRVFVEVLMFLGAVSFLLVALSCGAAALAHKDDSFNSIPFSILTLLRIILNDFSEGEYSTLNQDPVLMILVAFFLIMTIAFLLNMLVSQLNNMYAAVFSDMLGYARLQRGHTLLEVARHVSQKRWSYFTDSLSLGKRLEFNEGDIGLAGGIQTTEPAGLNPVTSDTIMRYGGSTSPGVPWPEGSKDQEDEDRFERMEKMVAKAMKRITKVVSHKGGKSSKSPHSNGGSSGSSLGSLGSAMDGDKDSDGASE